MTKVNAPKRLTSMSLRNQSVKDQRMRMTSERRTDDSAIRKERAHLSCQLKASFVVNDHYRDFPPIEGSARGWPNLESSPKDPQQVGFRRTEPDFNDSSSCPKRRCSRATMTAAVSCDATQTVDERNRDVTPISRSPNVQSDKMFPLNRRSSLLGALGKRASSDLSLRTRHWSRGA